MLASTIIVAEVDLSENMISFIDQKVNLVMPLVLNNRTNEELAFTVFYRLVRRDNMVVCDGSVVKMIAGWICWSIILTDLSWHELCPIFQGWRRPESTGVTLFVCSHDKVPQTRGETSNEEVYSSFLSVGPLDKSATLLPANSDAVVSADWQKRNDKPENKVVRNSSPLTTTREHLSQTTSYTLHEQRRLVWSFTLPSWHLPSRHRFWTGDHHSSSKSPLESYRTRTLRLWSGEASPRAKRPIWRQSRMGSNTG